jgi:F0F1-type ATP synthase assembly protein I
MEPERQPSEGKKKLKDIAVYSGLAMQMLGSMLICVYLGHLLDKHTGWKFPAGTMAGMFIGLFAALYPVIKKTSNKN